MLTLLGTYMCSGSRETAVMGSQCYKIVAFAAPSEWVLALAWAAWMLNFSYDLYYARRFAGLVQRHLQLHGDPKALVR